MAIYVNFSEMNEAKIEVKSIKEKVLTEMDTFNQMTSETNQDWKGSDANAFISNTMEKVSRLANDYNECLTDIGNEIDRNLQKFEDAQKRNLSTIE